MPAADLTRSAAVPQCRSAASSWDVMSVVSMYRCTAANDGSPLPTDARPLPGTVTLRFLGLWRHDRPSLDVFFPITLL